MIDLVLPSYNLSLWYAQRLAADLADDLLRALEDAHGRLADAVRRATPETLAQPAPERMRARFPTLGNMLLGFMTAHEGTHLGQLSAWRRALGLPSVL